MDLKQNNFQIQKDTIPTNQIGIDLIEEPAKTELNIQRNTIEIVKIRELTIDSTRLVKPKKKIIPIKKTIPQVLINDTIDIPTYSVANNSFILLKDESFFDNLHFTPYNPILKNKEYNNNHIKHKNTTVNTVIPKKELILHKKTNSPTNFISTDWMLFVILFSLILFSWLRVGFNKFFKTSIQASYNYFSARRMIEEVNMTRTRVYFFMDFLFYVNIALFISQYLSYHHIDVYNIQGILLFFLLFIAILVLYLLKSILFKFLGFIFLSQELFYAYNFTTFLYNKMIGIILLPIISILPYIPNYITPWLFYIGFFLIISLYILRIFRNLQISFINRLSIFYLILYLCTVEILPVLIMYKIIVSYI